METIFPIFDTLHYFEFKSYYVVWKLSQRISKLIAEKTGLNRTMQYGNWVFPPPRGRDKEFKSYYVVWKL